MRTPELHITKEGISYLIRTAYSEPIFHLRFQYSFPSNWSLNVDRKANCTVLLHKMMKSQRMKRKRTIGGNNWPWSMSFFSAHQCVDKTLLTICNFSCICSSNMYIGGSISYSSSVFYKRIFPITLHNVIRIMIFIVWVRHLVLFTHFYLSWLMDFL